MRRLAMVVAGGLCSAAVVAAAVEAQVELQVEPQGEPPAAVACRVCSNRGCIDCSKHGKLLPKEQREAGTVLCSVASECKVCEGALTLDCKTCNNGPVEHGMLLRRQLAREWLQQRRTKIDQYGKNQPYLHLQTAHFDLCFAIRAATVGKEKLDTHPLMHLYGERLEALRKLFLETLELPETDMPDRLAVFMFREAADHAVIGPRETGLGTANSAGLKNMWPPFVYSMWQDLRTMPDDEGLHRNVVHNVTHLLLSQLPPMMWLGNRKHGWLDEGVAHWFEDKLTGKCTNYCFEEVLLQAGAGFKGGRWRMPVRKLVDEGEAVAFAELSSLNTDQLTFEQHAFAFAYVDFLVKAHGGPKFRDFLRLIKAEQPTRDALQTVYRCSPLAIDPLFQQWVKDNYSPR